ncbi:MAG: TIGR01777 family oxidoreductase [Bacteroidetes bacterium]|nr:TIGR01777 family oxidoreductase [Bacteroidota bacterium]
MQTVLITGGTGMVGTSLTELLLSKGYEVIILTRKPQVSQIPNLTYAVWNIAKGNIDPLAFEKADAIVHLAGAGVADKRWSKKRKQEIVDSRVMSGALLVKYLTEIPNQVKTVVAASAIGWYGPDTQQSLQNGFTETDPVDAAFLGDTCKRWEDSVKPIETLGIRLVTLRIGIVLNKQGGALAEFIKPAQFGMATIFGNGQQIVSWIHHHDLCRMILFGIETTSLKGVYNAVSPDPKSNKDLIIAITKKLRGFYLPLPVPAFVLEIILGEMSVEILKSAKVSSNKIQDAGFNFDYPSLHSALNDLL